MRSCQQTVHPRVYRSSAFQMEDELKSPVDLEEFDKDEAVMQGFKFGKIND